VDGKEDRMLKPLTEKPNVDYLVDLLRAACDDAGMNDILERLLSQPEERRQLIVRELIADFRSKGAPQELISAFMPLLDDAIADTAWRVLYRCSSNPLVR
jgi:hypothetical protein